MNAYPQASPPLADPSGPEPSPLMSRTLLMVLGVIVLLALSYWVFRPKPSESATSYYEVRSGDFTVSIIEGGTLAAVSEISIRNEVEGTSRIIFIVPEGSYVKKGDLLVELDSAQAQDQVNLQQINYEKAQFALVQAQQQLEIQRSTTNSDIRAAALKLAFAKLDLEKFERGQRIVDLIEASNKFVQAEAQLAVNLENYNWTTNLFEKGYETKQKLDVDRLAVLNNRNSLIVASNTIWMLQEFDQRKQKETFESNVREAEQELVRVQAQSQRKISQFEADLLSQSNTLSLNLKKLERDRKNLDATKIRAPQDGLVVYPVGENRFSSESLIEEGAVVRNRQELIKLPDTTRMKVTIRVHESHVNMVRHGLPAYVILDSMPDERFAGVVEKVALLPDTQSRWGNPNLKVYNTEVYITDKLPDIKPGVSAKAEVIITNIANTLSVPIQAVTTLKGRQVVYLARGANPEPKPVEVGLYNTKFIQLVSGVKAGDRVLLAPPFDTEEKDLEGAVLAADEKARVATNRPPGKSSSSPATPSRALTTSNPEAPAGPRGPNSRMDPTSDAGPRNSAGPGDPNATSAGGPRGNREEMLKRFDKDGDGELNEAERNAMRQAFGGSRSNRADRPRRPTEGSTP